MQTERRRQTKFLIAIASLVLILSGLVLYPNQDPILAQNDVSLHLNPGELHKLNTNFLQEPAIEVQAKPIPSRSVTPLLDLTPLAPPIQMGDDSLIEPNEQRNLPARVTTLLDAGFYHPALVAQARETLLNLASQLEKENEAEVDKALDRDELFGRRSAAGSARPERLARAGSDRPLSAAWPGRSDRLDRERNEAIYTAIRLWARSSGFADTLRKSVEKEDPVTLRSILPRETTEHKLLEDFAKMLGIKNPPRSEMRLWTITLDFRSKRAPVVMTVESPEDELEYEINSQGKFSRG